MNSNRALWSLSLLLGCTSQPAGPCGPESDPTPPAPRADLAGAWDAAGDRLIAVGGDLGTPIDCVPQPSFTTQTVALLPECAGFQTLGGSTVPHARGGHALARDPGGGALYLHGGRHRDAGVGGEYDLFGDLWSLNLSAGTWTELDGDGEPAGRFGHGLVFAGDRLLVFGGNGARSPSAVAARADLWSYTLASGAWAQIATTGGPSARQQHAAVGSDDGRRAFVFGGTAASDGPFLGELWQLDVATSTWTLLHDGLGAGPGRRVDAALLFDSANNRLLVFGGRDDAVLGARNDVLGFDLSARAWSTLSAGDVALSGAGSSCARPSEAIEQDLGAPERRSTGAVDLDDAGRIVIFGGRSECGLLDDAWRWDPSDGWEELHPASAGESCARRGVSCATLCL